MAKHNSSTKITVVSFHDVAELFFDKYPKTPLQVVANLTAHPQYQAKYDKPYSSVFLVGEDMFIRPHLDQRGPTIPLLPSGDTYEVGTDYANLVNLLENGSNVGQEVLVVTVWPDRAGSCAEVLRSLDYVVNDGDIWDPVAR